MPGRPQVGRLGGLRGEPDRVRDRAAGLDRRLDLAVVQQPRQDGQAGRVGGGPARGPEPVGGQVPDRARAGRRARGRVPGLPQLVERAGGLADHDRVAVAAGVLASLDQRVRAERVRALVALAGVLELDRDQRVRARDDVVGDAEREPAGIRPEIGVQVEAGPSPCSASRRRCGRSPATGRCRCSRHCWRGTSGSSALRGPWCRPRLGWWRAGAGWPRGRCRCPRPVPGPRSRPGPCRVRCRNRAGQGPGAGGGAARRQERQRCGHREDADRCGT